MPLTARQRDSNLITLSAYAAGQISKNQLQCAP